MNDLIVKIGDSVVKLTETTGSVSTMGACIGAGIAMLGALGCGVGEGIAASKACEAVGRNPEVENKVRTMMIIGCAISETSGIYGFVIALIMVFSK
ncbi:MAG: ATP synthase F0 subunit C [Mycoplasmataceae bacterium]|jgi:F-type H+-transporting ATPase subunit c|nr:ATP synthase F0 subunit C [Mycoplasmataceae bacterium]